MKDSISAKEIPPIVEMTLVCPDSTFASALLIPIFFICTMTSIERHPESLVVRDLPIGKQMKNSTAVTEIFLLES